jgi:hypothetical protein
VKLAALLAALLCTAACRPSATVERTTPVASLQIYRSLLVRVGSAGRGQDQVGALQQMIANQVQQRCAFSNVSFAGPGEPGDGELIVDLTIQKAARGGGGLLQNPNLFEMDVLVVLSDAVDGELVGSALVRGKSSGMLIEGEATPEDQAVEVVGNTIGEILGKSGCGGERIARQAPTPTPTPTDPTPTDPSTDPNTAKRAEADAANEAGKDKFRSGDPRGALADFHRAMQLLPDARYAMNVCLAHEALEQWDAADAACRQVLAMTPPEALASKAKQRLDIIGQRRGG